MNCRFHDAQAGFRAALCDSFNTPAALSVLRDLVSYSNIYINSRNVSTNLDVSVIERIAIWSGNMLRMFGLGEGESKEIGWGQDVGEGTVDVSYANNAHRLNGLTRRSYHPPLI